MICLSMFVECTWVHPKQSKLHTQITISRYSYIDYSTWICRNCLGSTWTFGVDAPRPQRHKNHCVALSQDNHTCDMCYSPIRWPSLLPKGRRALPEKLKSRWKKSSCMGIDIDNHPLCNEVFNYSGMYSLFDAVATQKFCFVNLIFLCHSVVCYLTGVDVGNWTGRGTLDEKPIWGQITTSESRHELKRAA